MKTMPSNTTSSGDDGAMIRSCEELGWLAEGHPLLSLTKKQQYTVYSAQ